MKKKRDKNSYFSKGKQQEEALIECEICGNFYSNDVPGGCPVCRSKG